MVQERKIKSRKKTHLENDVDDFVNIFEAFFRQIDHNIEKSKSARKCIVTSQ